VDVPFEVDHMDKIATPRDLISKLSAVLSYAQTQNPSRVRIAEELNDIATSVLPTKTAGLKNVTEKEFLKALANAGWPAPQYSHTKRTMDVYYKDRGVEVAHKTQIMTRGKVTQETFSANPDYLKDKEEK